ncbi:hypothetical protein [Sulfurimonas sp.]
MSFAYDYTEVQKIVLKKDEQKEILVKYANSEKLFTLRWTLYVNEGLVVFHAYDKHVAQNVLYLNHKNQSFRVVLKTLGADYYNPPYILVKFQEFDAKKNRAIFKLYLFDKNLQIKLKYLKNKIIL